MINNPLDNEYRFVALDVETASSDAASICQIGIACVSLDNSIKTWGTYVDPGVSFSPFNIHVHGIHPDHVKGAPNFARAISQFEPLLSCHHIIQHSSFDRRAINGAFAVLSREAPKWLWGDSVRIARKAWPEFKDSGGYGLANLRQRLDLKFKHHDAAEDARAAAEVVLQAEAHTGLTFDVLLSLT